MPPGKYGTMVAGKRLFNIILDTSNELKRMYIKIEKLSVIWDNWLWNNFNITTYCLRLDGYMFGSNNYCVPIFDLSVFNGVTMTLPRTATPLKIYQGYGMPTSRWNGVTWHLLTSLAFLALCWLVWFIIISNIFVGKYQTLKSMW